MGHAAIACGDILVDMYACCGRLLLGSRCGSSWIDDLGGLAGGSARTSFRRLESSGAS